MEMVATYFGLWVRMTHHELGLSAVEFANAIGFHPMTISKHCRGKTRVSLNTMLRYAQFFEVDWVNLYDLYLLGDIENGNELKREAKDEIIEKLEKQRKNDKSY